MPIIGGVTGGLDFSNYYTALSSKVQPGLSYVDAKKQGPVLGWGQFLTIALNFLIIAWVLFLAIKGINRLKTVSLSLCWRQRGSRDAEKNLPRHLPARRPRSSS
jgi:large-conductance mechanosensitive channel